MSIPPFLAEQQCVVVGRRLLHQLRAALERDQGPQAAAVLQEAGFAGGGELYSAFAAWATSTYDVTDPGELDQSHLSEALTQFFVATGWGPLTAQPLGDAVLALDASEWAEAGEVGSSELPSCHLSCGLLAEFFGRLSGQVTAVMQVECPSRGDPRARFLAGAPETLSVVYDRMAQGMTYDQALGLAQV